MWLCAPLSVPHAHRISAYLVGKSSLDGRPFQLNLGEAVTGGQKIPWHARVKQTHGGIWVVHEVHLQLVGGAQLEGTRFQLRKIACHVFSPEKQKAVALSQR